MIFDPAQFIEARQRIVQRSRILPFICQKESRNCKAWIRIGELKMVQRKREIDKKKLGLILNPVAGMGGSVGLAGTDHLVAEALRRGAAPHAADRVRIALSQLLELRENLTVLTYPGPMGGDLASSMGFHTMLLTQKAESADSASPLSIHAAPGSFSHALSGSSNNEDTEKANDETLTPSIDSAFPFSTTREDTLTLASQLLQEGADLILFAGGDGTAIDVYQAVGLDAPALGIPAGVKIHSPVYGKTPKDAGILAGLWLSGKVTKTREAEVLDIDEEQYRQNVMSTRLFGYLRVPAEKTYVQNRKAPTPLSDTAASESIAQEILRIMEPDVFYLIGAGTTTRAIMELLELPYTLIGVDLICNRKLIANDVYGTNILEHIAGHRTKLIVTVTGGQGFLFGRGNQQLIPQVIRQVGKENISIIMTKSKLAELSGQPLLADTPDEELNRELCGYYRVITGYGEYTMCRVCDG